MKSQPTASASRKGSVRLAILLSATWAIVVMAVGGLESQTRTQYTRFFAAMAAASSATKGQAYGQIALGPATKVTDGSGTKLNPDDYFDPVPTWTFDVQKFAIVLLAPIVAIWLIVLALLPGVRWVLRGYRNEA